MIVPALYLIHFIFICYLTDFKFRNGVCHSSNTLSSKTVIITGANSGIGLTTSIDIARRGARVILACRNEYKGMEAQNIVRAASKNDNVYFKQLDLSSLASIRSFSETILQEEDKIHILINNAGVY
ncbi:SDR family NAD(P)-dependent oxidoreductase, partial [Salmonella sp. s51228]|uniref:SDR family NAD(P)-dependent oxidoreductase n=1 Tax=Salmonella sp. s51228 TaxID=3159652 RepID=UPI0039808494